MANKNKKRGGKRRILYLDAAHDGYVLIATGRGAYGRLPRAVGWFTSRENACDYARAGRKTFGHRVVDSRTGKTVCGGAR